MIIENILFNLIKLSEYLNFLVILFFLLYNKMKDVLHHL